MKFRPTAADRDRAARTVRAGLLLEASTAVAIAGYVKRTTKNSMTRAQHAERARQALAALSPEDQQWVHDLEAGKINERGPLVAIVERRTGCEPFHDPPPPPPADDVVDLRDRRRRNGPDRPAPPAG